MNFIRTSLVFLSLSLAAACGTTNGSGGNPEPEPTPEQPECPPDEDNCAPLECPDPNDPAVHYLETDPDQCGLTDCGGPETDCIPCGEGQEYFEDDCGCGCIDLEPEPPVCPDAEDPAVHYITTDPSQCGLTDCGGPETDCIPCDLDQEYFENECGCGCIDPEG